MDRAPLRPVPSRPAGPVDPDAAIRHVAGALPDLDAPAVRAFALVALVGSSRAEAGPDAAAALYRARKQLRRAAWPLPGSGWCERAERLISDRIDGELEPPAPARLDVHLRNCPRCVEHERRLVQATDALISDFVPSPQPATPPVPAAAPPLSVVRHERGPGPEPRPFGTPIQLAPSGRHSPVVGRQENTATDLAWAALVAVSVGLAVIGLVIAVIGVIAAV